MLETGEGIRLNVMLDNMNPGLTKDAVLDLQTRGLREYVTLEASGGIEFENLESWQGCGVDVLSASALHRATKPVDLTCIFQGA
jgi:nicotinate-nucleotide pyrophosphorylase